MSRSVSHSAASSSSNASSNLHSELLSLLSHNDSVGVSDQQLRDHFGVRYEGLVIVINDLLRSNRIQLYYQGNSLIYKAINESIAAKFEGLGPEQILVYQVCERAGNRYASIEI